MQCDQYCQAWWGTLWPWAEANQGLLSILALGLALWAFVAENRRANKAEEKAAKEARKAEAREKELRRADRLDRRMAEFAAWRQSVLQFSAVVRDLLESMIVRGDEILRVAEQNLRRGADWGDLAHDVDNGLAAITPSCPHDPELLKLLSQARRAVINAERNDVARPPAELRSYVEYHQTKLTELQAEVAARAREMVDFRERLMNPPAAVILEQ